LVKVGYDIKREYIKLAERRIQEHKDNSLCLKKMTNSGKMAAVTKGD